MFLETGDAIFGFCAEFFTAECTCIDVTAAFFILLTEDGVAGVCALPNLPIIFVLGVVKLVLFVRTLFFLAILGLVAEPVIELKAGMFDLGKSLFRVLLLLAILFFFSIENLDFEHLSKNIKINLRYKRVFVLLNVIYSMVVFGFLILKSLNRSSNN
jgi:hypothetical protein